MYCDFPYFQVRTRQTSKPVEIDEFLSFLDPLVIDSLRNGSGVPYQPSKAAALKRKCLAASELTISGVSDKTPFNFAPYNILQTPRYRLRSHFPFIFLLLRSIRGFQRPNLYQANPIESSPKNSIYKKASVYTYQL